MKNNIFFSSDYKIYFHFARLKKQKKYLIIVYFKPDKNNQHL